MNQSKSIPLEAHLLLDHPDGGLVIGQSGQSMTPMYAVHKFMLSARLPIRPHRQSLLSWSSESGQMTFRCVAMESPARRPPDA